MITYDYGCGMQPGDESLSYELQVMILTLLERV
jgi:hypothetical protein